jgi:quercetin dioxygenase-like cupin family protein
MANLTLNQRAAHLLDPRDVETLDVMGPTIQFLTLPDEESFPCVMRGTIPPGGFVPLHSHADPETFLHVSGRLEGLTFSEEGFEWIRIEPGAIFHVPGGAKHAFRNPSQEPTVSIIVSTPKMGRFFQELGTPVQPGAHSSFPPSEGALRHFLEVAERYGYWNATPEENAQVGLSQLSHR